MKLIGTLEGEVFDIRVEEGRVRDTFDIYLNEKKYVIDAHTMSSEIVSVLINNRSYDIDLDRMNLKNTLDGRMTVRVRGRDIDLEMLDERRKKMKDAQLTSFSHSGVVEVLSPMPGKVLRVLVSKGERVEEGQGILVIEAMKMENELKAPKAGTIKNLHVNEGDSTESDALLLTVE